MRRVLMFVLLFSMSIPVPLLVAAPAAGQAAPGASIAGRATAANGRALAKAAIHLRDVTTGQIAATTTSTATGDFVFASLPAGSYVVEVVDVAGAIVATSAPIVAATGASITGVTVTASAVGGAAAAAAAGSFFGSTAGVVVLAATTAAVAGVTVAATRPTASPSR